MISVMNSNDFGLDRKVDVSGDESQSEVRVSEDNAVVDDSSVETTDYSSDRGAFVDMVGSEEMKVSHGVVGCSSETVTDVGGDVRASLVSAGCEGFRVSAEHANPAQESDVSVSGGDADAVESSRSGESRVPEIDCRGIDEEMEFRFCEIKNEDATPRGSGNKFRDRNGGIDHFGSRIEGDRVTCGEKGLAEVTHRVSDHKFDVFNGGLEHSVSGVGKGLVEVRNSSVSQYDSMLSMFDEFAANESGKASRTGSHALMGYENEIGDMVWGKVKSHPWWPGHIYNEAFATPSVRRTKREGHILVAFFGDSSYGWFDPAELIPFDPNFAEKSHQTNSRTFMRAVEEAVDEASRRCGLALACCCRNPYNFRPTNVQGYFFVDVVDFEPGGVYSVTQIKKSRDSFRPREALAFIKQLAVVPTVDENPSIDFIKNKATLFAYRKAVFEEFDETYAQAFGVQPVRPSHEPRETVVQPFKVPSRAPLSGRLVIAESLGKKKNSTKLNKAKDQTKKDRYLFKRRDEQDELRRHQVHLGQLSSSSQTAYVEGSSALAAGDYVLQKRAPAVSTKPQTPIKHERSVTIGRDGASAPSLDVTGQNPDYNSYLFEEKSSPEKGKGIQLIESIGSNVSTGPASVGASSLQGKGVFPGVVENVRHIFEPEGEVMMDFKQDAQSASKIKLVEGFQQSSSLPPTVEQLHGRERVQDGGKGAKKVKVLKRPLGELNAEKSASGEKKKKRKKELGPGMSSDRKRMTTGNSAALLGKVVGKSDQVGWPLREDFQVHHQKKVHGADSLLLPDSVGTGNIELELPQLLSDLHSLALNPFHGVERNSPAIAKDVFLKFRSLVYQKSLALSTATEAELNEACTVKYPSDTAVPDNFQGESIRDPSALKPRKPPVRPDDPTKGGRKRGPSDRQEEIAAKRLKKITDLKTLAAEKKAVQKTPDAPRGDFKETVSPAPPKQVRIDSTKKIEPPVKTPEPTMLVMKFPPGTNLPSGSELKARLARFGPLDHSGTRVFWKSYTCRVVFLYKHDAQAAHKYLSGGSSLFGNVSLRCHIREMGASASESEPSKVLKEDTSGETPQLRDSAVEQKLPVTPAQQRLQQQTAVQLKSCLKKPSGDETAPAPGGNGGGRGTPRVKFMLGGEESSRGGEQLMVSNKNINFINNATSFADGGASSSTTLAMDFNSKNFQKVILPLPLPILPLPNAQYSKAPNNMHYTDVAVAPRIPHNLNTVSAPTAALPSATNVDIAQQMLNLLSRCNDVVTNVKNILGYVPYHPL
ncbi:PWWP domain-containing protein 1-like isoform X2 [Cornus florida]|uniref:PWWP domain-containing protein 1-like isoform X2 n=1 Tax=Cornus florida TaxID=4283 RepID=UPI0028989CA0|nr:PWWP domain-containing protein 1-like isoform X2 [Cornus florida]